VKLQYSAFGCAMAFVALDERKKTRHRHTVSVGTPCWQPCDKIQELGIMCRPIRTRDVLLSKAYFDVILVTRGAAPKHAQSKYV